MNGHVLALNGGSSSIKAALFSAGDPPVRRVSARIERIGLPGCELSVSFAGGGRAAERRPVEAADHGRAAIALLDGLADHAELAQPVAVGHRIVHGADHPHDACLVTDDLLGRLERAARLQPDHLPGELALVRAVRERYSAVPQVACFDSAFHRHMPRVARLLPLPRRYEAQGVRRYGFHGLSFASLMQELSRVAGAEAARGRVILAHLGSGASLAAVRDGRCVDTTMSFTPASGLVMATRSGDLDPGVLVHLMRGEGLDAEAVNDLVNRRSGLLGVSGLGPDMRDLLAAEDGDPAAADAVALFCHQARRWIGALATVLGGLDTLVFAGGIGENAPAIRERLCAGLEFLGVRLDAGRNMAGDGRIAADDSPADVRVIRSDEEAMIARHVLRVLGGDRDGPER